MRVTYLGVSHPQTYIDANSVQIPLHTESVSNELRSSDAVPLLESTFLARVQGASMVDFGVYSNDILVVDRSLTAKHGDVIIASVHGEMTVKTLELKPDVLLRPKNKAYKAIMITEESEFEVFGVVTSVIRQLNRQ